METGNVFLAVTHAEDTFFVLLTRKPTKRPAKSCFCVAMQHRFKNCFMPQVIVLLFRPMIRLLPNFQLCIAHLLSRTKVFFLRFLAIDVS